ncbi:MAG: hypothetical protein JWP97_749 [Labilithrix sp.]|nr:hypothetical protein [Labilithrix sp.]
MTTIVATTSVSDFFGEIVGDAMRSRGLKASEGATTYVVGLLAELAKPGSPVEKTLERPLTFLLDEAMNTPALAERFDKLRTLGDGVLYSSGFFADHFEARGVDTRYVMSIGRTAYENAGSLLRNREQTEERTFDLFAELAKDFNAFVSVLAEVANATIAKSVATSQGVLKLYERWVKTRSERLGEALASHGFVAGRGGGLVS